VSLELRLIAVLVAVLALLGGGAALWTKGYSVGKRAEAAEREKTAKAQQEANDKETARIRNEGHALATDLLIKLGNREDLVERTSQQLAQALRRPALCPAGGSIGDLVLPADLVDSMFSREPRPAANAASAGAPGR
jgi:hypothetical protein